jgi:hypothetical protein
MLRRWGKNRDRGRTAVMHAIDILEALVNVQLRDHLVDKMVPKQ